MTPTPSPDRIWFNPAYGTVSLEDDGSRGHEYVRVTPSPALPPPASEPVIIAFGEGKVIIDTGTANGRPAVFIAPAKQPGEVGASAAREGHDLHSLQPGEIVLTFPTDEQARAVENALIPLAAPPQEPAEDVAELVERLNTSAEAADDHAASGSNVSFVDPKSAWAYDALLFREAVTTLSRQSAYLLAIRRKVEETEADASKALEFTNELGNRIRITVEGPTSTSENILTPMEGEQLRDALVAELGLPAIIKRRLEIYETRWQEWQPKAESSQRTAEEMRKALEEEKHVIAVIDREFGSWECHDADENLTDISNLIAAERESFRALTSGDTK